jgi:hypothetical protein
MVLGEPIIRKHLGSRSPHSQPGGEKVTEIRPISLRSLGLNQDLKSTRGSRFFVPAGCLVAALFLASCAFWWPTFASIARFAFLCCCPTVFPFCYALVCVTPGVRDHRIRKLLSTTLLVHCGLVAGLVFAWFKLPVSEGIEAMGWFWVIEVLVIILLIRFGRRATNPNERS